MELMILIYSLTTIEQDFDTLSYNFNLRSMLEFVVEEASISRFIVKKNLQSVIDYMVFVGVCSYFNAIN